MLTPVSPPTVLLVAMLVLLTPALGARLRAALVRGAHRLTLGVAVLAGGLAGRTPACVLDAFLEIKRDYAGRLAFAGTLTMLTITLLGVMAVVGAPAPDSDGMQQLLPLLILVFEFMFVLVVYESVTRALASYPANTPRCYRRPLATSAVRDIFLHLDPPVPKHPA